MHPIPLHGTRANGVRVAAAAAGALMLASCSRSPQASAPPEPGDRVAAQVGGETVWTSDVRRQAVVDGALRQGEALAPASDLYRRTLDEVIDAKLLAREALRLRLDRAPAARRRLEAAREKVLGDMVVEGAVDRALNETAVRTLYQEQQRLSRQSEQIRARQILTPTQDQAEAVRKLLAAGAKFEALALQRSSDPATRFNGGDLGYFTLETMPAAYGAALRAARPGEIVGPFVTNVGWVVMRVEDRRPEPPIPFEQARPQIVRFLSYDEIRTLLTRLRQGAHIQVLAPTPNPAPASRR